MLQKQSKTTVFCGPPAWGFGRGAKDSLPQKFSMLWNFTHDLDLDGLFQWKESGKWIDLMGEQVLSLDSSGNEPADDYTNFYVNISK
jgi:hypothetical protein